MRLSDEDRRRIYEEEKARIEARERIEAEREAEEVRQKTEDKRRGWMVILGIAAIILAPGLSSVVSLRIASLRNLLLRHQQSHLRLLHSSQPPDHQTRKDGRVVNKPMLTSMTT